MLAAGGAGARWRAPAPDLVSAASARAAGASCGRRTSRALSTPALFAHGSDDPFGSLDEIEAARALIPARTALLAIDGAGHGLGPAAAPPRPVGGVVDRVADAFLDFTKETHA